MCGLLAETVRYKRFAKVISTWSNCVNEFRILQECLRSVLYHYSGKAGGVM